MLHTLIRIHINLRDNLQWNINELDDSSKAVVWKKSKRQKMKMNRK